MRKESVAHDTAEENVGVALVSLLNLSDPAGSTGHTVQHRKGTAADRLQLSALCLEIGKIKIFY